jgi:hypothetical protein
MHLSRARKWGRQVGAFTAVLSLSLLCALICMYATCAYATHRAGNRRGGQAISLFLPMHC